MFVTKHPKFVEKMVKREKTYATREYTINLAKKVSKVAFKRRAPTAIKKIKLFAEKEFGTKDVRIDVNLNKLVWGRGIAKVPRRIRVRCARKLNEDEKAKGQHYCIVTHVQTTSFKSLGTQKVEEQ